MITLFQSSFRRCVTGSRLELTHLPNSLSRKCFFSFFLLVLLFSQPGFWAHGYIFFKRTPLYRPPCHPPLSYPFERSLYPSRSIDGASRRKNRKNLCKVQTIFKGFDHRAAAFNMCQPTGPVSASYKDMWVSIHPPPFFPFSYIPSLPLSLISPSL